MSYANNPGMGSGLQTGTFNSRKNTGTGKMNTTGKSNTMNGTGKMNTGKKTNTGHKSGSNAVNTADVGNDEPEFNAEDF